MTDIANIGYVGITTRAAGNADELRDRAIVNFTAAFPDVVLAPGMPLWHVFDALAEEAAASELVLIDRFDNGNDEWAANYLGLTRSIATKAIGTVTVTATDDLTHTFEAGHPMVIDGQVFQAVEDTIIVTAQSGVRIVAAVAGAAGNVTGTVTDQGSLSWVDSITLDAATTLGADLQDLATYRDSVAREFRVLGSAATIEELELLVLNVPVVARVLAVRGFVPPSTTGVANAVCLFVCDSQGDAPDTAVMDLLADLVQAQRITSLTVNVEPPTYTTVAVTATITIRSGYDSATVVAACEAAIETLLSPANFPGNITGGDNTWFNLSYVYRADIDAALMQVPGVLQVTASTVGGGASLALTGPAPLTRPGTITITAA